MTTKNSLPYADSSSGKKAIGEMESIMAKLGCQSFGSLMNFETGVMTIQFVHKNRRVSIEASAKAYADAFMQREPWTSRKRISLEAYRAKALQIGTTATYSILRDFLKATAVMIECGVVSMDQAFFAHLVLDDGRSLYQHAVSKRLLPPPAKD